MGLYIIHIPLEYRETTFRLGLGVLRDRYEKILDYYTTTNLNSGCDKSPVSKLSLMGRSSGYVVPTSSIFRSYRTSIEEV